MTFRHLLAVVALLVGLGSVGEVSAQSLVASLPPPLNGYGTLSVSTSSVAISTLTKGPSSLNYPTGALPSSYITIRNSVSSASILYVCWFGGTCTSSVGEPIAIGETAVRNLGGSTVSPTVISGGTSTLIAGW